LPLMSPAISSSLNLSDIWRSAMPETSRSRARAVGRHVQRPTSCL
jgi:hypothetical protein